MVNNNIIELNSIIMANPSNSELDRQIEQLKRCECIKESEVRDLCNKAREILLEESNIQNIYSPITVSYYSTKRSIDLW